MIFDINKEIARYKKNALIHQECTITGDYRKGNAAAGSIEKINRKLLRIEVNQAYIFIDEVLNSDIPNAIMWIAPVSVSLNYRIDVVKILLQTYATDQKMGILSIDASMLLQNINKNLPH